LWCDFDNGKRRTDERFEALAKARNLPETTPLYYVSMPTPWLDAGDFLSVEELVQRIKRLGAKLVVVDNLGTVTGKADENSAEMIQVMSNLRYVAENAGATIITIHHQRKSSGIAGRSGEMLRGHSSIEAALDLALLVEREEHSDVITIRSTKTRDVDVFPFGAQFDYVQRLGSNELATAKFLGIEVDDQTSGNAVKNAIQDVVKLHQPINKKDIVTEVKKQLPNIGTNRIRGMIDKLVDLGILVTSPGPRTTILYSVP